MQKVKKRGFTLVELIIVIAVIGVLAAILIPVFSNVIRKANAKSALADARNAVSLYVAESLEKRTQGDTSAPENIVIIVSKGGRYYLFGFNTAMSESILVSDANENGIDVQDLNALIGSYSWNSLQGTAYDPSTAAEYTIETGGAFYLVPYTGTTPDNPNVRGFNVASSTSEIYHRLDDDDIGGFNLNIGSDTVIYHGCLIKGTYAQTGATTGDNTQSGGTTPSTPTEPGTPDTPVNHTVTFAFTGLTSGDEANVVVKIGTNVLTNPAQIEDGTYVNTITAEYPHDENTDDHWYTVGSATADSSVIHGDTTVTFNFTRVNVYTLSFVMGSGETFVPASGVSATMRFRQGDDIAATVRNSAATTETAGQTFRYWTEQGSTENFAPGTGVLTMPARNVTLVPYFSLQNISVTYRSGDHATGSDYADTVTYGSHALPSFNDIATAAGWTMDANYDFLRWYDGDNEYAAGASYSFTNTTTLTARYTELQYTVTVNQPSGVTAVTGSGTYNMSVASVDITVTLNSNYYLTGYSVSGLSGTTTLPVDATSINTSAAQAGDDIRITPNVAAKTVNVTFVSSPTGATGMPSSGIRTFTTDGNTISLTTPAGIAHYSFSNYTVTIEDNATGTINGSILTLATNSTGSVTVTANFTADPTYSISYDANAGSDTVTGMPSNQTGLYPGSHDLSSATPVRDGYTFQGWGATAGATSAISSVTITSANVTVYAIWEENAVSTDVYYFGGAYRHADQTLDWNATKLPEVSGNRPLNILDSLTLDTTLLNGTVVHRTFEETSQVSTIDGVDYIKCTETTDWSAVSGVTIVEQTAGATYSGSQSIVTILNTSSMRKNNTTNNSKNKQFVLIADMDLTSVAWKSSILSDTYDYFMGRFDGMGYTANGMSSVDETSKCNTSFFGLMTNVNSPVGAQNFNITNANISYTLSPKDYNIGLIASGLSGSSSNQAVIRNCHVSGNISMDIISATNKSFCGISNVTATVGVIENSSATVNISAYSKYSTDTTANVKVGGISAMCLGTIRNCWFKGTIMSNTHRGVGGIAGNAGTQTGITVNIQNCSSEGFISGLAGVGGIFGNNTVDSTINITNCHSTANVCCLGPNSKSASGYSLPVNGAMGAGGICGSVTTGKVIINKCWAKGDFYSDGGGVGGIVGVPSSTSRITDCWSAGRVGARQLYTDAVGTNSVHVYVYNGIGGITGCGKVGDSGSVMAQDNIKRCVTYADVYAGGNLNNSKVFGYGYSSGNTSDAGYRMNTVKSATVNINTTTGVISISGGSTLTPADNTSTVCSVVSDAATLISSIQSSWTTTSAWNLSSTYPRLVDNPGSPV